MSSHTETGDAIENQEDMLYVLCTVKSRQILVQEHAFLLDLHAHKQISIPILAFAESSQ